MIEKRRKEEEKKKREREHKVTKRSTVSARL
jgi:hypothetical protein